MRRKDYIGMDIVSSFVYMSLPYPYLTRDDDEERMQFVMWKTRCREDGKRIGEMGISYADMDREAYLRLQSKLFTVI